MSRSPDRIAAQDNEGSWIFVNPGIIDGHAKWLFTRGQCLALAAAVSSDTGYPVVVITLADKSVKHALVRTPEGFMDITGLVTALEIEPGASEEEWEAEMVERMTEYYSDRMPQQNVSLARLFVDAVLQQFNDQLKVNGTPQCT